MIFAVLTARRERVPRGVDGPLVVGGNRAAAIHAVAASGEISLRLERGAVRVTTRVEKRRARLVEGRIDQAFRRGGVGSVPNDMHAPAAADRDLSAANRASRDRAARLAVDADRRRESPAVVPGADVEQV